MLSGTCAFILTLPKKKETCMCGCIARSYYRNSFWNCYFVVLIQDIRYPRVTVTEGLSTLYLPRDSLAVNIDARYQSTGQVLSLLASREAQRCPSRQGPDFPIRARYYCTSPPPRSLHPHYSPIPRPRDAGHTDLLES